MKARVVLYPRALMAAAAPQEQAKPLPPLPDTALLYWEDTWHLRDEATVLRAWRAEGEEGRWCVALDRTIFHPQGGGQPADVGEMRVGARVFAVDAVRREGAVVVHQGEPLALRSRALGPR
jgi:alanyl-tRNA synthetase